MSILIIIAIILIISAISDFGAAKDWETSQKLEERRHEEMMDLQRELHQDLKKEIRKSRKSHSSRGPVYTDRKRYIKDRHGNIIAEEYITRKGSDSYLSDYDDYDDDYDDYDDEY